jgi:hypothetical protein
VYATGPSSSPRWTKLQVWSLVSYAYLPTYSASILNRRSPQRNPKTPYSPILGLRPLTSSSPPSAVAFNLLGTRLSTSQQLWPSEISNHLPNITPMLTKDSQFYAAYKHSRPNVWSPTEHGRTPQPSPRYTCTSGPSTLPSP